MELKKTDPDIYSLIQKENLRQQETINLIASENYVSQSILAATATAFTNKYSDGYPQKRYYQGNDNVDAIENIAIERAKKLFSAEHANVQPYSGSTANAAAMRAVIRSEPMAWSKARRAGLKYSIFNIQYSAGRQLKGCDL